MRDNLRMQPRAAGAHLSEARLVHALAEAGLDAEFLDRDGATLSGGEKQRVTISQPLCDPSATGRSSRTPSPSADTSHGGGFAGVGLTWGDPQMTFRVHLRGLEPRKTYYYVTSMESNGTSDGVQSRVGQFTTP